jgi:hypothetical protein
MRNARRNNLRIAWVDYQEAFDCVHIAGQKNQQN